MTKRDDCKRFEIIRNVGIQDNLTGRLIMTMRECCNQLNNESDKADRLAEELFELKYKRDCRMCIHYACDNVDNYCIKKEYDSLGSVDDAKGCKYYEVY